MSIIVALVGPIEYWWDTPEDPHRFDSFAAVEYRAWRETLNDYFVNKGFLVFRPHEAFKGAWDERAQVFNDEMIKIVDLVVSMRPPGIPGKGTDHEIALAQSLGKHVIHVPPNSSIAVLDLWLNRSLDKEPVEAYN